MKDILLLSVAIFFSQFVYGQQVLNGNMEDWDTTFFPPYPVNWLTNSFFASLPCSPEPFTAESTNDSYSGCCAIQLEAKDCIDDMFNQQVYIGFLAYGNTANPNLAHGMPYNQRPTHLNFYYKFYQVGSDTGFAKITLRLLDSAGYAGQIVGEGKASIINDTNAYTLMSVPVNYSLPNTPEIMQIVFSTSKTLADKEYFSLNTTPGNGANIGTILWIDDVNIVQNPTNVYSTSVETTAIKIYPNPNTGEFVIEMSISKVQDIEIKLFNVMGQVIYSENLKRFKGEYLKRINTKGLSTGVYQLQIKTGYGEVNKKVVIE